jgi:hypothetical protein
MAQNGKKIDCKLMAQNGKNFTFALAFQLYMKLIEMQKKSKIIGA